MSAQRDYRKLIEQEKAAEKAAEEATAKAGEKEVPWGTRRAWWGILGLIAIDIVFLIVISSLVGSGIVQLPAPVAAGIITALLYAAVFGLVYYLTRARLDALAFKSFPVLKAVGYVLLSFIGVYVFEIFWLFFLRVIGVQAPDTAGPVTDLFGVSALGFVVVFILTVIIAPVVEEIFFRLFLYQAFRKRYGVILGILISALLFGLFHFSFLIVLPVFVVIGIFLGYVFEKFHSVYPSIMLHALNNLVFFLILVFTTR